MSVTRLCSDCPMCLRPLVRKRRRDGGEEFISCSGYPDCKFAESLDLNLQRIRRDLDDVTRDRDELLYILRTGRPAE